LFSNIFDGNWVDVGTLVVALFYAYYRRGEHQRLISKETGLRVAHGVALFPLFLLACSSVSSSALNALLHSHKIILSVAGVVALLAILEEDPPS
jgi:hypothetical protein